MKNGMLIILSGPSGVGKGTIRKILMANHAELNLKYSISMTTRIPRNQEVNGVDYFFVSDKEFQENLIKDNFLENACFVGHCYGTPKNYVVDLLKQGYNVLLEIEVNGAMQIMNNWKDSDVVSIFLTTPSIEVLQERIMNRKTESPEIIAERLAKASSELNLSSNYNYTVINDDQNRAAEEIASILKLNIDKKAQ
ncbi:MAG: guanylate kinase [Bacilli bacterium]